MKALILGFIVIILSVLLVLPIGLGWWEDVLTFLRGALPVISFLIGIILVFTGITDIKERVDAKKEASQKGDK